MKWTIREYFSGIFPIEKLTTRYNYLEVNKSRGRLVLDSEHVNYSFGRLHQVFQKAFELTKRDVSSFRKALLLGFGAGSVAHILQKELDFKGTLTGVEIDPEVIVLARKYFGLGDLRDLKIEIDDAYDFVFREKQQYDLIVVDLFIDHLIPEKFDRKEFIIRLNRLLEEGGMLLYNRMNQSFKDKARTELMWKTFGEVFKTPGLLEEFNIDSTNVVFHVKK